MEQPTDPPLSAIVLAAGQGSRMLSERPKPLHRLCGRPMLLYVLDALRDLHLDRAVVVVGHKADWVTKKMQEHVQDAELEFVEQRVQRGTGDAAMVGLVALPDDLLDDEGDVVVVPGDTPLLRSSTVDALVSHHRATGAAATVLTAVMADPGTNGRVVRAPDGRVQRIVEHGDATPEERALEEVNTSVYCFRRNLLTPALRRIQPDNAQGEYYLTDVIGVLVGAGHRVDAVVADEPEETQGVNDRAQLAQAEAELRRRTNEHLLRTGVTLVDPSATYVDTTVVVGTDVTLFPGVMLQGDTVIGDGTEVGPGCRLVDTAVGDECVLEATVCNGARIGDRCQVGPFAHLGPGAEVAADTVTGAFYTPLDL
jgi:bifunctional UDP-N-acetylglucosamine pyrophosphorylase/glucosamine-1-phosphate N-acetyltransferase